MLKIKGKSRLEGKTNFPKNLTTTNELIVAMMRRQVVNQIGDKYWMPILFMGQLKPQMSITDKNNQ